MLLRHIRLFFTALRMTLKGETPPISPYAPLVEWIRQADKLLSAVYAAADKNGIHQEQRKSITLRIDSRSMSVETILATVRHHTSTEYLYMIHDHATHSITAIYASNLNDRHFVERLQAAPEIKNAAVKQVIEKLSAHLGAIPSTNKDS